MDLRKDRVVITEGVTGLWFSLKAVDLGYYACIVAVYVYQSRLWDSEWVEIGVLEEETKERVDSVFFHNSY